MDQVETLKGREIEREVRRVFGVLVLSCTVFFLFLPIFQLRTVL